MIIKVEVQVNNIRLKIKDIKTDGGTQTRVELNSEIIKSYAEDMLEEKEFPPVVVFYDGSNYWLADGFHRVKASNKAGFTEVDAEVRQGTRRDAILYSVSANSSHGLRRTNQDKRNAVLTLLRDDEWTKWSDRKIAEKCGVSNDFVSRIRKSLSFNDSERTYITKHGTTAIMNTTNIGGKRQDAQAEKIRDDHATHLESQKGGLQGEIQPEKEVSNEEQSQLPTGQPAASDENYCPVTERDSTIETVDELIVTIKRRLQRLSKKDYDRAISNLIKKLKNEV